MDRRHFLKTSLTTGVSAGVGASLAGSWAPLSAMADDLPDVKITRVVGFDLVTHRDKLVGRNSRLNVHGDRSMDRMIRIYTNTGAEGLGPCRSSQADVAKLLGKNPLTLIDQQHHQTISPLGRRTTALWDLAGKLLEKPVYELLGGEGREKVPVYDGSIYFIDLLPQFADNWQDRFKQEIDMARADGHRGAKVKIGRGAKWMERAAGDARDVEVIRLIREHAGDDFVIGVDANNGYNLAITKRFLEQVGDLNLAFVEEMFPETVEECLELKAFIAKHGWKTLVADGESQRSPAGFKPFVQADAIDVMQGDMKHFGFELLLEEAKLGAAKNILVAPHNWGSLLGYYMQLHVGRAVKNFYMAEHDPLKTDVLLAEGYTRAGGLATVPDAPGLGLALDEKKFKSKAIVKFDLKG